MADTVRSRAIQFAMSVILRSTDWQEVQDALANHDEFGRWLGDDQSGCHSIIREAEKRIGKRMPAGYA